MTKKQKIIKTFQENPQLTIKEITELVGGTRSHTSKVLLEAGIEANRSKKKSKIDSVAKEVFSLLDLGVPVTRIKKQIKVKTSYMNLRKFIIKNKKA